MPSFTRMGDSHHDDLFRLFQNFDGRSLLDESPTLSTGLGGQSDSHGAEYDAFRSLSCAQSPDLASQPLLRQPGPAESFLDISALSSQAQLYAGPDGRHSEEAESPPPSLAMHFAPLSRGTQLPTSGSPLSAGRMLGGTPASAPWALSGAINGSGIDFRASSAAERPGYGIATVLHREQRGSGATHRDEEPLFPLPSLPATPMCLPLQGGMSAPNVTQVPRDQTESAEWVPPPPAWFEDAAGSAGMPAWQMAVMGDIGDVPRPHVHHHSGNPADSAPQGWNIPPARADLPFKSRVSGESSSSLCACQAPPGPSLGGPVPPVMMTHQLRPAQRALGPQHLDPGFQSGDSDREQQQQQWERLYRAAAEGFPLVQPSKPAGPGRRPSEAQQASSQAVMPLTPAGMDRSNQCSPSATSIKGLALSKGQAKALTLRLLASTLGGRHVKTASPSKAVLGKMLRAEQRRRGAAKHALGAKMQQMAIQLQIVEEKERRIAQQIDDLDRAVFQMRDSSADMLPVISQIVDDLNVLRKGAIPFRKRMATGFDLALFDLKPHHAWNQIRDSLSTRAVCRAFMDGKEALTFQQLAVRNNQAVSLHQIAGMTQQELNTLYQEYMDACKAAFPVAMGNDLGRAIEAQKAIARYLKESSLIRVTHVIGQTQMRNLFSRQQPGSLPMEVLTRVAEAGRFKQEQLADMWRHWQGCLAKMAQLKPAELALHDRLATALSRAVDHHSRGPRYLELIDTAAELKANLEAQAWAVFRFNCTVNISCLQPMQTAAMHVACAPHPLRVHLLFLAGLVPKPQDPRHAPPPVLIRLS